MFDTNSAVESRIKTNIFGDNVVRDDGDDDDGMDGVNTSAELKKSSLSRGLDTPGPKKYMARLHSAAPCNWTEWAYR